jgi:hypothetical protein
VKGGLVARSVTYNTLQTIRRATRVSHTHNDAAVANDEEYKADRRDNEQRELPKNVTNVPSNKPREPKRLSGQWQVYE